MTIIKTNGRGWTISLPVGTFVRESDRMLSMVTPKYTPPIYIAIPILPEKMKNKEEYIVDKATQDIIPHHIHLFRNTDGTYDITRIKGAVTRLVNIYLKANNITLDKDDTQI